MLEVIFGIFRVNSGHRRPTVIRIFWPAERNLGVWVVLANQIRLVIIIFVKSRVKK